MADFCKQCSIDTFGEDTGDLAHPGAPPLLLWSALCEGCGPTYVDNEGACQCDCDKHHVPSTEKDAEE